MAAPAGAPQWSALLAIADQGRASNGQPALDSSNPQQVMNILYSDQADFHDITSGTSTGSPDYSAGSGYDYVTGLGTPLANQVVGALDATASPDRLVLAATTDDTAGMTFNLTVTAQNSSGTTDTRYTGTIQFTSSDLQAGLPASFTFTAADAGTYTFPVVLKTAGSQSITATDTSLSAITGTLSGISVSPAPASQFVLSDLPSTTTAGLVQNIAVTAEDPYGNVATNYAGTVQFTSSDLHASLPANFPCTLAGEGMHVFKVAFEAAGTQWLTVTDTASGITATQSGITVQAAAAATLKVSGFPTSDTAGAVSSVVVTAYDAYGNVATGYTGSVSLASSDPRAVLPAIYTFSPADQGSHAFPVALETTGVQAITATATSAASLTGTESNIGVQAADARTLEITGFPATARAGVPSTVTVTAYDAYGNVATGYTGTIAFNCSDGQAILPSSFCFIAADTGTSTFAVTLETAGAQTITATDTRDSAITGTESGITVWATPQITWTTPAPITYGTPLGTGQLDAWTDVPGTFTYTPAPGTILAAGSLQTLLVTFTPQPGTDYTTAGATTTITVGKAAPIVRVTDSGGHFDGSPFPASVTIAAPFAGTDGSPASSLENVTPTLTYFIGSANAGVSLGATPPSAPGTYAVVATFPGTADYSATISTPVSFTIGQGRATVVLGSSSGSAVYGQTVTFTARVETVAGPPSGTVRFCDGTTLLATVSLDGSGTANFATSALAAGSHPITATYSGDTDFLGVQSAPYCADGDPDLHRGGRAPECGSQETATGRSHADRRDQAHGARRRLTDRRGDLRAGHDVNEEGESDHAGDRIAHRRGGSLDIPSQPGGAKKNHRPLQRRP